MAIQQDIWGSPDSWVTPVSVQRPSSITELLMPFGYEKIKLANFGTEENHKSTIYDGVQKGVLNYGNADPDDIGTCHMDKSLCFAGLGKEAAANNVRLINIWGGEIDPNIPDDEFNINKPVDNLPFFFYVNESNAIVAPTAYFSYDNNNYGRRSDTPSAYGENHQYWAVKKTYKNSPDYIEARPLSAMVANGSIGQISPVVSFDHRDLRFMVCVKAFHKNETGAPEWHMFSLDAYCNKHVTKGSTTYLNKEYYNCVSGVFLLAFVSTPYDALSHIGNPEEIFGDFFKKPFYTTPASGNASNTFGVCTMGTVHGYVNNGRDWANDPISYRMYETINYNQSVSVLYRSAGIVTGEEQNRDTGNYNHKYMATHEIGYTVTESGNSYTLPALGSDVPICGFCIAGFQGESYVNTGTWYANNILGGGLGFFDKMYWANDRCYLYSDVADFGDFFEWSLRQAACYGCFFSPTYYGSRYPSNTIDDVYLGLLDGDYIGHGDYTRGEDNRDNPLFDMVNPDDSRYDPDYHPIDPDYGEEGGTELNTGAINPTSGIFTRSYAMTRSALTGLPALVSGLYNIIPELTPDNPDDPLQIEQFERNLKSVLLTTNPIDNVLSCMMFPFDVAIAEHLADDRYVALGKYKFDGSPIEGSINRRPIVYGRQLTNTLVFLDCGYMTIDPATDFRDFEPYTTYELYVPYCGTVSLNPSEFAGTNVSVTILVDLMSGNCTAFVFRNNIVVTSISGNMGVQIPITGIAQADYMNSLHSAAQNVKAAKITQRQTQQSYFWADVQSAANTLAGVGSQGMGGNIMGALATAGQGILGSVARGSEEMFAMKNAEMNLDNAKYTLEHMQHPLRVVGTASPMTDMGSEQRCRLIVTKYQMLEDFSAGNYAHSTGYAVYDTVSNLSGYSGYTQLSNIDMSGIDATAAEKELINSLMLNGVYL